ncbi:hypothetical protein Gotur_033960 [Gossypium turneri]
MSQLMSMTGDIKRKIGTGIPSNTEDNPRREGKEHMKAIVLQSDKVLSSPENPTQEENKENSDDLHEEPSETDDEQELEEVAKPVPVEENEQFMRPTKSLIDDSMNNIRIPNYLLEILDPMQTHRAKDEQESEAGSENEEEGEGNEEMDFEEDD